MPDEQVASNYYQLLGLKPSASVQEIRQAYRELSKLYHPDTTELPAATATAKFHQLNEAYATLSSPDRRSQYDLKIGYSRVSVIQPRPPMTLSTPTRRYRSSAYLDPTDRPLSAGELFALFILGVTFVGCLLLVFAVGMTRGDIAVNSFDPRHIAESVRSQIQQSFTKPISEENSPANNPALDAPGNAADAPGNAAETNTAESAQPVEIHVEMQTMPPGAAAPMPVPPPDSSENAAAPS